MTNHTTLNPVPNYWTPARERRRSWLRRQSPPLADLYEAAVRLYEDRAFPGRINLVCHAVREIRNALPEVMGSDVKGHFDCDASVRGIRRIWRKTGYRLHEVTATDAVTQDLLGVPNLVGRGFEALMLEHDAAGDRSRSKALQLFMAVAPDSSEGQLRPLARIWWETTEWFVEEVHDKRRKEIAGPEKSDDLDKRFELFEAHLDGFTDEAFIEKLDGLDEILDAANS